MSGMIDTGKHPELGRYLAAAPFRSGTQLMIELMEDGLRLRGFAVDGVGAEAATAGAETVKRGRGRPATRRADYPLPAITQGSTLLSDAAQQPKPPPVTSHEGEDGKPSQGLSSAAASMLESMLNL